MRGANVLIRRLTFLLTLLLMVACAPGTPASMPAPSATAAPSQTPAPSVTATLTAAPSATPTRTATATVSASATATAVAALDQAEVIRINDGIGGIGLVLKIPNLSSVYNLILGGIRFDCTLDAKYPDWLFCWGLKRPPLDIPLQQAFLDPQSGKVVNIRQVVLSSLTLPTALPEGYADTNCPDRGKNISCETECRIDPNGSPCIVATCTDACGLYRSVQSCPENMTLPSPICSPEQAAAAKAKYGIP
jgi:hypothetical protein